MNKVIILSIIIVIYLFYNSFIGVNGALTFDDVTYDKSNYHQYGKSNSRCLITTYAMLLDPDNTNFFNFDVTQDGGSDLTATRVFFKSTGIYYKLEFNVPTGSGSVNIIGTNGIDSIPKLMNISCTQLTFGDIVIVERTKIHASVFGFAGARFRVGGGLLYPLESASLYGSGSVDTYQMILSNSYFYYYIERSSWLVPPMVSAAIDMGMGYSFPISEENNYKVDNIEVVTDVTLYPNGQQDIELMGNLYAPLFTWKSNSEYYAPSFRLLVETNTPSNNGFVFRPISTEGLITKYIGFMDYRGINNVLSNYLFVAQDKTDNTIRGSFNLNIKAASYLLPTPTGTIVQSDVLININFQSTDEYYYSPVYYMFYELTTTKFPYGYKSGSNKAGYTYSASELMVSYDVNPWDFVVYKNYFDYTSSSLKQLLVSPLPVGSTDYKAGPHSLTHLYDNIFMLRIEIDNPYPLFKFKIGDTIFNFSPLVTGGQLVGTFEFVLDSISSWDYLKINDLKLNPIPINTGELYSFDHPPIVNPFLFQTNFDYLDIKNATILYKTMNVTNQEAGNILYFNYTNIDINTPISFIANGPVTYHEDGEGDPKITKEYYDRMYHAKWNSTINMFQVEFWLPKNSQAGKVPFALVFKFDRWVLSGDMGDDAQFTVISNNADLYGPIFTSVVAYPSNSNTIITGTLEFGWILTIEDASGFRDGTVKVRGVEDGSEYIFKLTATSNIKSDQYSVELTAISNCYSQDYVISDVTLYDIENNNSTFSITFDETGQLSRSLYNPFINYLNDTNINRISLTCDTNVIDPTPPYISSLDVSHNSIDVGASIRIVQFSMVVKDDESGLKPNHSPTIYLSTVNTEIISCTYKTLTIIDTKSTRFEYEIQLPLGFGYPYGMLISVYGMVNNGGYYGGASSSELKDGFIAYKIDTTYTNNQPQIIGSSRISTDGGKLWIHGRGFKNVISAYLNYEINGYINQLVIENTVGDSAILIQNIPSSNTQISITVNTNLYFSNTYFITPFKRVPVPMSPILSSSDSTSSDSSSSSSSDSSTQLPTLTPFPTNKPQACLGTPECGGPNQGYCNGQIGCVCLSPWIGIDCSSKVIIVPQPSINTTDPSNEITVPPIDSSSSNAIEEILYKSFISLVSIRELDFKDEVIFTKTFDKWIYTPINDLKFKYECNISKTIDGLSVDTPITVNLEWFKQQTNISFANQQLTMNPSTLKYTIDIGQYTFSNQLNRLELIMSATFESTQTSDTCSSSEFGDTSSNDNANYLKLSIEDHSMYARFLKRGIVDGNVVSISNRLLDSSFKQHPDTEYSTSSFIGIAIPNYEKFVSIDPDFSVLLNHDDASDNDGSICSSKPTLSAGAIAGIVIGAVAFLSVIIISIVYSFHKSKKNAKFLKSMHNKLGKINS